ncbi:MAG TPA: hypothetical protein VM891_02275 [Amaricoccus sp.]|jgi:hypothetical protein|nr:hypothetical protein [Amaricoccus sp.]
MGHSDAFDEGSREGGWLADYRRAVEQLRGETVAELGAQPMPPEALSAIALAVAALPVVAMMLPSMPLEPQVWQVAVAMVAVWLAAFRIQSVRYARFHERWQRKVVALAAAATTAGADELRFLQRR